MYVTTVRRHVTFYRFQLEAHCLISHVFLQAGEKGEIIFPSVLSIDISIVYRCIYFPPARNICIKQ
jgi:hypothetical protein